MSRNLGIIIAALCAAFSLASTAHAASVLVYTPTSAIAGGGVGGGTYAGSGTELINGDGLDPSVPVPASFSSVSQLPKHNEDVFDMWEANTTNTGWVVFNLGSVKSFNTIIVWNDGEEAHAAPSDGGIIDLSGRSVNNLTIYSDNSPITPSGTTPFTGNGANVVETTTFSQATNASLPSTNVLPSLDWNLDYNIVPVVYTLPSYVTAQYVEFNIASSWTGGGYVGLSEVRFGATPEPASLGLLVIGGAVLLGKRRRRMA